MENTSAKTRAGDRRARAVNPCSAHAHGLPEPRAEQSRRTTESENAEIAYQDWSGAPPSQRPLASQRLAFATILFEVLRAHGVSRNRFADMIGVNEKQVRKMLKGFSPIPIAALGVMPLEMAIDFMDRVVSRRGGHGYRAEVMIRHGIAALRTSSQASALRVALDCQRELVDLARDLSEAK